VPLLAGIGLAIAKDLLAHGYTVFANGRNEERLTKAYADLPGPQRSRVM
jgi:NADP-dependent 3-hydroxy acid dehydrogenase YdfG